MRACSKGSATGGGAPGATRDQPAAAPLESGAWLQGELLNAESLTRELGLPHASAPETLLLAAWLRWRDGIFDRLEGIFAAAFWDREQITLYRDPSGLCNLVWHEDTAADGTAALRFATDLGDPRLGQGDPPRMARHSLHEFLRFLDISAPHTIVGGVRAIEAGRAMRWPAAVAPSSVDAPPRPRMVEPPASLEQAVDELEGLLGRAVARCLDGAERPAAFLSGGIDSSLICALAHRVRPDTVALTVGFDGERYDEAPLAARIAAHLGMQHEVLRFRHEDVAAAFERLAARMEQPMADPAAAVTVLALDRCRERFDLMLDGTGADEAVGAMPPRHLRLAVQYGSLVPRPVRRAMVRAMRLLPGLAGYTPILDFEHPADTLARWRGFTRREIEELCGEPVSFEHTQFYRSFARFPRHEHFERYGALLDAMPSDRLAQAARITGMHLRYPFFDRGANRFIRQLPTAFKVQPGQPKRILRELLARHVPRAIWDLPKHGFDFPLQAFLDADDHALVRRHLLEGRWLDGGVLDRDAVRRYARGYIDGDRRLAFRVWALVVLGAWLDAHPMAP